MRMSGRDFRINANTSRTSFGSMSIGGESNTAKPVNRLPKQRPHLIGANKPHMLKNQNDHIRQMLGKDSKPQLEPIDPSKVRSMRNSSLRASHKLDGSNKKPGANPLGATPSLQASDKMSNFDASSSIGGTPGKRAQSKKIGMDLRQTGRSVNKAAFGSSSNRGGFGHANDA